MNVLVRSARALCSAVLFVLAVAAAASSSGCARVRPWERGKLAHPTMTGPGVPGPAEAHVYAVHEGAVGGGAGIESGCGCN